MALLFAADRMEHLRTEIEPTLAQGVHVISDRYVMSSMAYQSVELPLDWVETINRHARPPDLTVLMRVSPETAAHRRGLRGGADELYDQLRIQKQVAENYDRLVEQLPEHRIVVLDATPPFDDVYAAFEALVLPLLTSQEAQNVAEAP